MKLSICMMVKNEEKFLDKCLTNLEKFMSNIDSELIIVDTGSEDNTVSIARKYTDKVYFHKWNNNFSEMRNITISYANGEWIFIIDADEMLIEYEDIINFFHSEYVAKYNTVFINVKNLTESDETTYSIISSARIFKNDGEFKYAGAVHNEPVFKEPCAHVSGVIEHYGYIFTDKEFTEKKFIRTSNILKNELLKNPDNIYYWYQLSVSYSMHNDKQDALECAIKAFEIMEKKIEKNTLKNYLYVYTQLALCYLKIEDLGQVEYVCTKAIEAKIKHIDVYYLLGKSQLLNDKNSEAIKAYEKYIAALDNYNNKDNTNTQTYYHGKRDYVLFDLFILHKRVRNINKSIEYYKKIQDPSLFTHDEAIEENIDIYLTLNDYNALKDFYHSIILEYGKRDKFILYLEKYQDKNQIDIVKIRSIISEDDLYTHLIDFRLAIKNNDNKYLNNIEINHMGDINFSELYYFYGDILYYYMRYSFNKFIDYIKILKEKKIFEYFKYLNNKYNDFKELLLAMFDINEQEDIFIICMKKIIAKYLIASSDIEQVNYKYIFSTYLECGISYIEKVYNTELLNREQIYYLNDEETAFFVYIRKARMLRKTDEKKYLYYLKEALNIYPYMHNGIKLLLDEIKEDEVNKEMGKYKEQVVNAIKLLINEKNFKAAEELIGELEKIVGSSSEIEAIKSMFT